MIPREKIDAAVRILAEAANPARVLVFGSYARGDAREDSDLDLLVIEPRVDDRAQEMIRLQGLLRPLRIPVDVLVYTEAEAANLGGQPGSPLYWPLRDAGCWPLPDMGLRERARSYMAEVSAAKLLLDAAKRDQQAFRTLAAVAEMNDAAIGFHAQQAVEKALKAALAHAGVAFQRTHNLGALLDLLRAAGRPLPPFSEGLVVLSPYAVGIRYDGSEPAALDRATASEIVEAVLAWAEAQLAQPANPEERDS